MDPHSLEDVIDRPSKKKGNYTFCSSIDLNFCSSIDLNFCSSIDHLALCIRSLQIPFHPIFAIEVPL